jgi:phosphatidylinositol alpha 1,6-mannosyltransferase
MRVAIITESFPPDVNGVAHCVLRVAELLAARGHQPLVVAPQPPRKTQPREPGPFPYPVVRVPAVPLPGYPSFRLGLPSRRVHDALIRHQTEVVHLASPVVLGAHGAAVARRLGLPVVAVFQTDLPSYARAYRLGRAGEAFAWRWLRGIHNAAARTLAPSTVTATGLLGRGIVNVWLWGRGVDTVRFDPARRSEEIRARLAPSGELIAGYVGRLATEKRVELLAKITALSGVRLVIVGAGPAEAMLRQHLPTAVFLGERRGDELAAIYASLDVFVHSGPYETFGQTLQEAAASGLPVVAPAAGGPLDLVENGVTGFLVPPGDPDAFAAAVARLAADPEARAEFGAAGRRKVLGRSWPALTEELIGHYAAVLGRTRGEADEREPSEAVGAAQALPRDDEPARVVRNLIPEQARRLAATEPRRAAGDEARRETAAGARTARASSEPGNAGTGSLGGFFAI